MPDYRLRPLLIGPLSARETALDAHQWREATTEAGVGFVGLLWAFWEEILQLIGDVMR